MKRIEVRWAEAPTVKRYQVEVERRSQARIHHTPSARKTWTKKKTKEKMAGAEQHEFDIMIEMSETWAAPEGGKE